MPPAALMSSTAWSPPFLSWAPNAALGPVNGPAMPSLTCASAAPASTRPRPTARLSGISFFIDFPLDDGGKRSGFPPCRRRPGFVRLKRQSSEKSLGFDGARRACGRATRPREETGADVAETVLGRHLGRARHPKAKESEQHADRAVDQIIVQRDQRAVEQGEMEEPDRRTQDQHVCDDVPPRPPGPGNRASGHPRGAAAHADGDEEEAPERAFFIEKFRDREIHREVLNAARLRGRRP